MMVASTNLSNFRHLCEARRRLGWRRFSVRFFFISAGRWDAVPDRREDWADRVSARQLMSYSDAVRMERPILVGSRSAARSSSRLDHLP